ncbi:MAG: nitroreductase family protein [Chlorobiales bacterium]|nr:nitroreductase family protein [Chlorobiales bacterium]
MIELLRKRRSIRKFTPEKISSESIETIIEAALRSPSSKGSNPWEFILVDNPDLLTRLSESKPNASLFLKNAPFAIVVCADSSKSDVWVEDCSIAAIIIQLTAESLGLGSCWIQIRNRQHNEASTAETYIQQLLNLPEHLKVASILAIGHPLEAKPPVPVENLMNEKIKYNSWA